MGTCKYYKQIKQVSYDGGQTWSNVYPSQYRKGSLYETNSQDCGGGGSTTLYRWVQMNPNTDYYCSGTTKYYKEVKEVSYDNGVTWGYTNPQEYRSGTVAEYNSTDCGYTPTPSTSGQYLTFVALEDGKFKLSGNSVSYSLDSGSTWTSIPSNAYTPTVLRGEKVMWKANLSLTVGTFSSTNRFNVEGNAMSLLYGDDFEDKTSLSGKTDIFMKLFYFCTLLESAENLVLPATTLSVGCYDRMFYACRSLTAAPSLPATTLADYCYYDMFWSCTSLVTAPQLLATTLASHCYDSMFIFCHSLASVPSVLPATTMAEYCYSSMFSHCISLTTVPQLPATTLAKHCYSGMFDYCTSLTTVPSDLLPATTLASSCYSQMFEECASLTTAPELPATTLADYCYSMMFNYCTSLTAAPQLPATTLASNCYSQMFQDCTSLTTAPQLSATTLAEWCYSMMFEGCTSLTTVPSVLPATTLSVGCYGRMFNGCTSLVTAPELPASTLKSYCYRFMFTDCTQLNYIKCLATSVSASYCTEDWLNNVSSSGTFVKAANMNSWTSGDSGIPNNWTITTAS